MKELSSLLIEFKLMIIKLLTRQNSGGAQCEPYEEIENINQSNEEYNK